MEEPHLGFEPYTHQLPLVFMREPIMKKAPVFFRRGLFGIPLYAFKRITVGPPPSDAV